MEGAGAMRSVLFVDDEPRVLEGLENLMFPYMDEWDMEFAEGGNQALALLNERPFDVIVTDMRMPNMDGAALLDHVRRSHPQIVRIVLSGHSEVDAALRAMPVAHQFLSKPCDARNLTRVLSQACRLNEIISDSRLQATIGDIDQLPARPVVYDRLCSILTTDDWTLTDVAAEVEKDMAIATRLLQVANTAFFFRGTTVKDLPTAVSRLGARFVRDLVLSFETFGSSDVGSVLDVDSLHRQGLSVGSIAKRMVQKDQAEDAFLAGLVHDVGRVVIAKYLPEKAREIAETMTERGLSAQEAEALILGHTHAEVGAYLLGLWGMPYPVLESVCHHHDLDHAERTEFGVTEAVHVAVALFEARARGTVANLDTAFLERLGVADQVAGWQQLVEREFEQ